jgi:glycosyltransferase involved in cell wall biosynthesis
VWAKLGQALDRLIIPLRVCRARVKVDLELGELNFEPRRQLGRNPRPGAKQEQSPTTPRAEDRQLRDQIHARDRSRHITALPSRGPNDARSVGEAEIGGLEHACELPIVVRAHHELGVDRRDEMVAAALDELLDPRQRRGHVHAVDSNPEHAGLIHRRTLSERTCRLHGDWLNVHQRMARIAVDVNPATREVATGTEVYTKEVGSRLARVAPDLEWTFFASRPAPGLGFDVLVVPFKRLWSQVRLPVALAATHPDLLFVPAHSVPFAWTGRALTVVHDLAFERHPEAYSRRERALLQVTTRWAVRRCPVLIAVSESTKQDLVSLYGADPRRVRVVPNGGGEPPVVRPAPASRLGALGIEGDFVLQVGRIEARKNQTAALSAVERLDGLTVVFAGPERDPATAAKLRASPRSRVLGLVDRPTLELLYKRARAVVVPSLYEGFGLPVLEAMARGQVVVAARNSSLPEVGGDAAFYVDDPNDAATFASVLDKAISDVARRAARARKAQAQARKFTWDGCAAGVVATIREVIA